MDYVKISRKILDWEWYTDINTKVLFLHILLKANWKDGRFQGIEIPRGSFVTSYQSLSDETGLTIRNVRTAIKHLENTEEVTVNRHAKFSVITVKNYNQYQTSDKQVTVNRQGSDSQVTTIEEGKKERKEEGKNNYQQIADMYNSICISYPKVQSLSDARKRALGARLRIYNLDDFRNLFEKAEASNFLKGENGRDWSANFDWLIKDSNMAKVLDGNYDCKTDKQQGRQLTDDFFTGG